MRSVHNSLLPVADKLSCCESGGICAHESIYPGAGIELLIYVTGISNRANVLKHKDLTFSALR